MMIDMMPSKVFIASLIKAKINNFVSDNPRNKTEKRRDHGKKTIIRVLNIAKPQKPISLYGLS